MPDFVLLEFMRSPEWFMHLIISSSRLDHHREAMLSAGRLCFFGDSVKILATPEDVNDILHYCSIAEFIRYDDGHIVPCQGLRARHVVVSAQWEADFMDALAATPGTGHMGGKCKDNVKVKRRTVLAVPPGPWHSAAASPSPPASRCPDVHLCMHMEL